MIYGKGINDMPYGWAKENELNRRIYRCWSSMIKRCYYEKYQQINPTYKGCYVCERWLKLSNFVEDISKIENYELWITGFNKKKNPYELDKDIKSNNKNKCYCLEQCQFVLQKDNGSKAHKGIHNSNLGFLVERYTLNGELIDIKYNYEFVEMGFDSGAISNCCRKKRNKHKGFIFKYHEEEE